MEILPFLRVICESDCSVRIPEENKARETIIQVLTDRVEDLETKVQKANEIMIVADQLVEALDEEKNLRQKLKEEIINELIRRGLVSKRAEKL